MQDHSEHKLDMTGSGSRPLQRTPALYHKISIKKIDIELSNPQGTVIAFRGSYEWIYTKFSFHWKYCMSMKCLGHESVLITSAVVVLIVLEKAGEKRRRR